MPRDYCCMNNNKASKQTGKANKRAANRKKRLDLTIIIIIIINLLVTCVKISSWLTMCSKVAANLGDTFIASRGTVAGFSSSLGG